jgi:CDP-2,3-bis-(O-geranylgeranyl)-sn-glycerol synthase
MTYINLAIIFFLYALPLYVANATPILIHGKTPLDFNKRLFGQPIFGKGKTILGTAAGITAGTLIGALILIFFPSIVQALLPDINYLYLSFTLAAGAILGDLVKSFFKRRFGIKSGQQWVLADQLDFIAGGLVLSALFIEIPAFWLTIVLLVTTFFIHSIANFIAFKLKLKKVPW